MQENNKTANVGGEQNQESAPVQKIAENPNPRANENIKHTPFDEKEASDAGTDVGTEITDGEAG
jgi:hypothetical protein